MEYYQEEIIKVVMINYLDNITPKNTIPSFNKNCKLLDLTYLEEINIHKLQAGINYFNPSSLDSESNLKMSIKFVSLFKLNEFILIYFLNAKIQSLLQNSRATLDLCSKYLQHKPLCCEVLLVKGQNELKINSVKDALESIGQWNKAHGSIYHQADDKNDAPKLIFTPNNKFNIYMYRNYYYVVPIDEDYYGVRVVLGKFFLIPNNDVVNIIRYFKKRLFYIYNSQNLFKLFKKVHLKNKASKRTKYQNKLLSGFIRIINKPINTLTLLIFQNCLGLVRPKPYLSFQEAADVTIILNEVNFESNIVI
jgi:hypothetical protein